MQLIGVAAIGRAFKDRAFKPMGQRLLHQELHGERLHFPQRQASFAPNIRQLLDNLQRAGSGDVVDARGEQPIESYRRAHRASSAATQTYPSRRAGSHQLHDIHVGLYFS